MELIVKNLGPISSAIIDLSKDLIVITGQNNTGKTFITTLIYSLYNQRYKVTSTKLPQKDSTYNENNIFIEIDLLSYFELNKENIKKEIIETLIKKIPTDFAIKSDSFKSLEIDIHFNDFFQKTIEKILISEVRSFQNIDEIDIQVDVRKDLDSQIVSFEIEQIEENLDNLDEFMKGVLADSVTKILFQKTFFIPAERQGINLFSKELTIIRKKMFDLLLEVDSKTSDELIKFARSKINRYPLPIVDNINFFEELSFKKNLHSTEFQEIVIAFEKDVLGGNISISNEGELKFITKDILIDINSMSSTVKSLSILMIYLKHVIGQNEFIIIDEPELNLHPDNQVKVIRFLTLLVNSGIKLLISTHSEYMIRELNSLILLKSALTKCEKEAHKMLKKYSYKEKELLDYNSMNVYLFLKDKQVKNLKIDNTGFEVETIDTVSDVINTISEDVYFNFF